MKQWKTICSAVFMLTVLMISCKCDDVETIFRADNQEFINDASVINQFLIAAGNLTVMKSTNQEVKQYAAQIVNDHAAAGQEMAELVNSKSWIWPVASEGNYKHNLEKISGLTGDAFDKEFTSQLVTSLQAAVKLFNLAVSDQGVKDQDLRNFAAAKLPVLRRHMESALALSKRYKI